MSLFNPSRDEVRQFFFSTWAKFKREAILSDLEKIALAVMHMHPEYHAILDSPAQFLQQEYFPEFGETNPFLHMSLHVSIREQIAINQPLGIAEMYAQLQVKYQDEHVAQHAILECLAETVWQAQRNNSALDSNNYVQLIRQKLK